MPPDEIVLLHFFHGCPSSVERLVERRGGVVTLPGSLLRLMIRAAWIARRWSRESNRDLMPEDTTWTRASRWPRFDDDMGDGDFNVDV